MKNVSYNKNQKQKMKQKFPWNFFENNFLLLWWWWTISSWRRAYFSLWCVLSCVIKKRKYKVQWIIICDASPAGRPKKEEFMTFSRVCILQMTHFKSTWAKRILIFFVLQKITVFEKQTKSLIFLQKKPNFMVVKN